jgi:hypothetical protein
VFESVTTSKKREIESGHFEVFRSGLLDFPDGKVLHEDNPDFLVITEEGPLGIELRQLFHPRPDVGPPLQALESNREAVLKQAREMCELDDLPPLFVCVDFDLCTPIPAGRRSLIAHKLFQLCADFLPSEGAPVELKRESLNSKFLPREIRELHIQRIGRRHHWTDIEAGMVLEDARQLLQNAINEKASKLDSYLRRCNRCWLLLTADAFRPSNFIDIDEATRSHTYESPFEKTYFLNCFDGDPIRLQTVKSGG